MVVSVYVCVLIAVDFLWLNRFGRVSSQTTFRSISFNRKHRLINRALRARRRARPRRAKRQIGWWGGSPRYRGSSSVSATSFARTTRRPASCRRACRCIARWSRVSPASSAQTPFAIHKRWRTWRLCLSPSGSIIPTSTVSASNCPINPSGFSSTTAQRWATPTTEGWQLAICNSNLIMSKCT